MFDGTYPLPDERVADQTDRQGRREITREPILVAGPRVPWEDTAPPVPTAEDLARPVVRGWSGWVI